MKTDEAIRHCNKLLEEVKNLGENNLDENDRAKLLGLRARIFDILSRVGGANNTFLNQIQSASSTQLAFHYDVTVAVLSSFIAHLEDGLVGGISPKYQAELDMVSELLEQANNLLINSKVHPAAPAVLIGATLEEFLRTWVEEAGLSLGSKKANLDSYTKLLRENELITKQDAKDITAWAGIRNDAAHGNWSEVGDKSRIKLMLEGVNLFIRQKTG